MKDSCGDAYLLSDFFPIDHLKSLHYFYYWYYHFFSRPSQQFQYHKMTNLKWDEPEMSSLKWDDAVYMITFRYSLIPDLAIIFSCRISTILRILNQILFFTKLIIARKVCIKSHEHIIVIYFNIKRHYDRMVMISELYNIFAAKWYRSECFRQ